MDGDMDGLSSGDKRFYRWTFYFAVLCACMVGYSIGTGNGGPGAAVVVLCVVLLVAIVLLSIMFGGVRVGIGFWSRRR